MDVDPWDGQDAAPIEEEEFSLDELFDDDDMIGGGGGDEDDGGGEL